MIDAEILSGRVRQAGEAARVALLGERNAAGWWEGELSASALATAVAVLALGEVELAGWAAGRNAVKEPKACGSVPDGPIGTDGAEGRRLIRGGLQWLAVTQLEDGGWGDTVKSRANVATTLLVWAAFGMGKKVFGGDGWGDLEEGVLETQRELRPPLGGFPGVVDRAEACIQREAGGLEPGHLKVALARRYGKDRTFAVPILMACAVGGRLGPAPACWREVPALPFELAAFPRRWFAALRLPVVSYALPALIAIGQVRHCHAPARGPWRWVRQAAVRATRRLLREIQPEGGGFLEAVPLTGFVTMALGAAGAGQGEVVKEAVAFLTRSVRADGSWPIDTNLATWGTTLSVKALGGDFPPESCVVVREWLLKQQYKMQHPYCMSAPGGWAWTDLPGGVPDADDTAGALLALSILGRRQEDSDVAAAEAGVRWLAGLQNADGGMPTFCKGWGALPFDRSAPDLTAHALAAWQAWRGVVPYDPEPTMRRAVAWLAKTQRPDGAWVPLWFGNEHEPGEENPVYGTAAVLKYLCRLPGREFPELEESRRRAAGYLVSVQQATGGWSGGAGGGPGSIEESGAAVEALVAFVDGIPEGAGAMVDLIGPAMAGAAAFLLAETADGTTFPPAPIGLYFAKLWYYEKLYPRIAAVSAFRVLGEWFTRRGA